MLHVGIAGLYARTGKTVACAAKLCYASADIGTVMEGLTEEKTASFLDMLGEIGHESPIEHASFTFGIEGVSVRCWRRLPDTALLLSACKVSAMSGRMISNLSCRRR